MAEILGAEVDEEGYLLNETDWTREIANAMSEEDGIELSPEHWEVINFLKSIIRSMNLPLLLEFLQKLLQKNLEMIKVIHVIYIHFFHMVLQSKAVDSLAYQNQLAAFEESLAALRRNDLQFNKR